MHSVLLIWEEVPEDTNLYLFTLNDENFEKVKRCHHKFIGSDDMTDDMEWLQNYLSEEFLLDKENPIEILSELPDVANKELTIVWAGFIL